MANRYEPINPKFPHMLHGADYNPEQWFETPEVIDEDFRLMKLAHLNVVSIGIFSWAMLEPQEDRFDFSWLDRIMDRLAENGMVAVLATPSGARPMWLARSYPEVLRVDEDRQRRLYGGRHNHCFTSPAYRERVRIINTKLAERYKEHPALFAWHISNEYSGECHCPYCQAAFRAFLKDKYGTIEKLNHEWWTGFWSHPYPDFSYIESPSSRGENELHGLKLDWKRFVTRQTVDFFKNEIEPLRRLTPNVPVTTNFMELCAAYDQWEMAAVEDVVSWDSYPRWHNDTQSNFETAMETAFAHDLNRSLKGGKPFMLMENVPGATNWMEINKLKRPGMIELAGMQAVAHGSDTVQYFQWRKSRGGFEKFHGAAVDHYGKEDTRVFREVAALGADLEKLDRVVGTSVKPEVAIFFDYQNQWAIEEAKFSNRPNLDYVKTCKEHYLPFFRRGIPVDIINEEADLSGYKLVIAPMLYMTREGVSERIRAFVKNGGTFVATYLSAMVNENDLCHLGGFPGGLMDVAGIFAEETDALYPGDKNSLVMTHGNSLGFGGSFEVKEICDLVHAKGAKVLAAYGSDFYAGRPALTVNAFGSGECYYIAARTGEDFLDAFYGSVAQTRSLARSIDAELPDGVSAQKRTDGENDYVFLMNFSPEAKTVAFSGAAQDLLTGEAVSGKAELPAFGFKILCLPAQKA